jgi:hypothetical protein
MFRDPLLEPKKDDLGRPVDDFDWRLIPLNILLVAGFWGAYYLIALAGTLIYRVLFLHVNGIPVYVALVVGLSCLILCALTFVLRDIRNWRSVAWLQIIISVIGTIVLVFGSTLTTSSILGFAAAIFSGANGFKRLYDIDQADSKMSQ